jgi:ankyrin repeat protein
MQVGSAVNKEKQTPLHLAAMEGFDDVVKVLLREVMTS